MAEQVFNLLEDLIKSAKALGADDADAIYVNGKSLSASVRFGNTETVEQSDGHDLGLRVFCGKKKAIVSSNDLNEKSIKLLAERAVTMAKASPDDLCSRIARPDELIKNIPELDLYDAEKPTTEALLEKIKATEEIALNTKGITNSEGAEGGWSESEVYLIASNGFQGHYKRSGHSLGVSVLAEDNGEKQREYSGHSAVRYNDLDPSAKIANKAASGAIKRLGARKVKSGSFPVIFDQRIAPSFLGHLAGAINGQSIVRKTSFLQNALNQQIFSSNIQIIDDPHRQWGLNSKPFDGEGGANQQTTIIEDGVLKTWVTDITTSDQLNVANTHHATRGPSSNPSPSLTNLYMQPGTISEKKLIASVKNGLYVTELIGTGVNGITGDYSRGAAGFWIENGEITFPVQEITIAGNLKDMFMSMTPADNLEFRYGFNTPSLFIDQMTIAGS
jgi:PmbA protein